MNHRRFRISLAALALAGTAATGLSACSSGSVTAGPTADSTRAVASPTAPSAPSSSTPAHTPTAPRSTGSTTGTTTDMSITFTHSVHGHTLTFQYTDSGHQHKWLDPSNEVFVSHEGAGHRVDFGDGKSTGSDAGAMKCSTIGSFPFKTAMPTGTHTYAEPGTYTVTVTGNYCGSASDPNAVGARNHVTREYTVVVH